MNDEGPVWPCSLKHLEVHPIFTKLATTWYNHVLGDVTGYKKIRCGPLNVWREWHIIGHIYPDTHGPAPIYEEIPGLDTPAADQADEDKVPKVVKADEDGQTIKEKFLSAHKSRSLG